MDTKPACEACEDTGTVRLPMTFARGGSHYAPLTKPCGYCDQGKTVAQAAAGDSSDTAPKGATD